ncbi:class I SAM-dependent methyltransferase [Flavobacterium sp. DG1-102-2]|uniref:class I SAM-dependent methyltransferase n=1 Tax=Flavobacterium sp. DG1-102-2 TaxID=3081663 RepID=UPI002949A923|nr:class I SAM-dependent methyltransferase [Flavobacterium sp. DG1-102-2]MDV6168076.1 class I SAM-dependent methyltransferase [Flavobacterium sp. DG1-102-2]
MKDNFSAQAVQYSQFRPYYPSEMIDHIVSFVTNKETALDVATGSGQVAIQLSKYFTEVYGTDISDKQLEHAAKADNIVYKKESAEQTSFGESQFDLITVAQAIHWFDFDAFFKEVYRILKPDGIFAVLGYGLFSANGDADKLLKHFYYDITGPYWDAERRYLDENYTTIPFPFEELETQEFVNEFTWTFEQLTGYLETWSAVQHYIKKNGTNPIDLIKEELKEIWEEGDKKVTFPLLLRIGKLR